MVSAMTSCFYCGGAVNPDDPWTRIRVVGWAKRPDRRAGALADIECRETRQEFACRKCIGKLKQGVAPGQASLV